MTLNGYFALNCVFAPVYVASRRATFENNCVKTNKDRHNIPSAAQIFGSDYSLWRFKVSADILAGSLENRRQRTVGSRVNARLKHLFLAFENSCVK